MKVPQFFASLVCAGLSLGALAAPAAAQPQWGNDRHWQNNTSRQAVRECTRNAENRAERRGFNRVRISQVRTIDQRGNRAEVQGRIQVENRFDRNNSNRWNQRDRWNEGYFTCRVDNRGRVQRVTFRGIRGL